MGLLSFLNIYPKSILILFKIKLQLINPNENSQFHVFEKLNKKNWLNDEFIFVNCAIYAFDK